MTDQKPKSVNLRLAPELHQAIKDISEKTGQSMNSMISNTLISTFMPTSVITNTSSYHDVSRGTISSSSGYIYSGSTTPSTFNFNLTVPPDSIGSFTEALLKLSGKEEDADQS